MSNLTPEMREKLLKCAKPILFNPEMVMALLEGQKTTTRRLIKPQPKMTLCYRFAGGKKEAGKWGYPAETAYLSWGDKYKRPNNFCVEDEHCLWTPPCHTDDILYVRETWAPMYPDMTSTEVCGYIYKTETEATMEESKCKDFLWPGRWCPSVHMPKAAARIFLRVTNVMTERLQDITVDGCRKERIYDDYQTLTAEYHEELIKKAYPETFQKLWDADIRKRDLCVYGWDANPWVWVIEFEVL